MKMLIEELKGRLAKMWWDIVKVVAQQKQHKVSPQWQQEQQEREKTQFGGQETLEMQPVTQVAQPQTRTYPNPPAATPSTQQQFGTQQQIGGGQISPSEAPIPGDTTITDTNWQGRSIPVGAQGYRQTLQPAQSANVQSTVGTTAARTQADASDIAETAPKQLGQIRQTGQAMGQHADLSSRIMQVSGEAAKNTGMQKKLLGRIRFLLREANIPEVKVATGLPGDIQ
jgi:hypothetical protein